MSCTHRTGAMKVLSRTCCGQSICRAVLCKSWRGAGARDFHSSRTTRSGQPVDESSQYQPKLSDEAYSIYIDPESKTVTTPVATLPVSPIMDPSFHEIRQRYRRPKQRPAKSIYKPTKFQRLLARNPYAQALATPVRRCPVTSTALPKFFLQRFNLASHPETGNPWIVPQDLDSKVPRAAATQPEEEQEPSTSEPEESSPAASPHSPSEPATTRKRLSGSAPAPASSRRQHRGPSCYVLARQRLLQEFRAERSEFFRADRRRLFRISDRGPTHLTPALGAATWRDDMDAVLLELMRRRVVEGLLHFAGMVEREGRKYVVRCREWDEVKGLKHRGCLLVLGGGMRDGGGGGVPRLSTMEIEGVRFGGRLAVHDLETLLGEEHTARLRKESALLGEGELFLLGRRATIKLQMLLWKLQGYMAYPGERSSETEDIEGMIREIRSQ
ncbi:hypothetical protein VTK26DRAFT_7480 [Humicola hyalothermophila]